MEAEENNMSIGELIDYLKSMPKALHYLPVTVTWDGVVRNVTENVFNFTDGGRYYSLKFLEGTAPAATKGISLEIDAN